MNYCNGCEHLEVQDPAKTKGYSEKCIYYDALLRRKGFSKKIPVPYYCKQKTMTDSIKLKEDTLSLLYNITNSQTGCFGTWTGYIPQLRKTTVDNLIKRLEVELAIEKG